MNDDVKRTAMTRMTMKFKATLLLAALMLVQATASAAPPPRMEQRGQATQLIVDGKPFLVLGGELHNSSSSDLAYLGKLWAPLKAQHLNTALVAVSWQLVEPEEGRFDFTLVDGIVKDARANNMKVVLLWFGSWKNGLSHYAPGWVKRDGTRFPRIVLENGRQTETISALSGEGAQADARAFARMMRHLKQIDAQQQTVIMVQVENEVGVLGAPRDFSKRANEAFAGPVPAQLLKHLAEQQAGLRPHLLALWNGAGRKNAGSWPEVFGTTPAAHEAFMAWHYASYINTVAAAGKAEYALPLFVNAWIVQPQDRRPGDYPSGGPQAHVHDIWRAAAPSIDFLSPDIYLPDTEAIAAAYHHPWNPLFIPESFAGENGAANAFYVIGRHSAIGYSPFGIDNKIDKPHESPIAKAYAVLAQLAPEIGAAQAKGAITGFSVSTQTPVQSVQLGGYRITATLRRNWNGVAQTAKGYGIVMQTGADKFTVAGADLDVMFEPIGPGARQAGIVEARDVTFAGGRWLAGRVLNGDDIMMSYKLSDEAAANRSGTGVRLQPAPGIVQVELYRFD